MRKKVFIIYIFSILSLNLHSQTLDKELILAMEEIYNFNFDKADSIISIIDSLENPLQFNFLKAHHIRWKNIPIHHADESIIDTYGRHLNAQIENYSTSFDSLIRINNALLEAEFHYNNASYTKAFSSGSSIYKVISPKINEEITDVSLNWLLPVSLYNYYYSYYQENNAFLASLMWLFKEGDKKKGLEGLKRITNSDHFAKTEALVYLSHIYLRIEDQPDSALRYAQELYDLHPDNLKFNELLIESKLANNIQDSLNNELIKRMLKSTNSYFNKYGLCYEILNRDDCSIIEVENTLDKIEKLGGGNHLKSLLYKVAHEIEPENSEYQKLLVDNRAYHYVLTKKAILSK